MFEFLFQMNDAPLYALVTGFFIVTSLIGITLVKWIFPLEWRYSDNAAIGNTIAVLSIIYAVLVGFTALYLINNNSATDDAVQREANAVSDIYRDSKWLKQPARHQLHDIVKNYLHEVVDIEWPLMKQGRNIDLDKGYDLVEQLTDVLINYNTTVTSESLLLHDLLDEVRALADARQVRIHGSYGELSPELWFVIVITTFLTLAMNYIFGMNFYLHIASITSISIIMASMMFLLITVDRPFQGEFAIDPDSFQQILTYIDSADKKSAKVGVPAT
jgi:hypothetical protein